MLMADTMAIFFVVLGLMISLVGLWLLARGLWPKRVTLAAERFERGLVVPFVVGLPIALVAIVSAMVVANLPAKAGGIGAGAILCGFFAFASVGLSGLATCVGRRLASSIDAENPWRATLRGAVVLVAAFLVPILGWFALLPIAVIAGAGAAALALVPRRAERAAPAGVAVVAPQS
jgi:hypothetical protein